MKCEYCGIEFKKRNYNQKFCSTLCKQRFYGSINNYRHGKPRKCVQCGKEFIGYRKSNKFCSRQCAVIGRSGPTKKQERLIRYCSYCGNSIELRESRIISKKDFYCSNKCKADHYRFLYRGEANPNYKNVPGKICLGCKKEFWSSSKNRKFCSQFCRLTFKKSKAIAMLSKGLNAEKKLAKELRSKGYNVTESKASRGDFDLIAINDNEILLIQVKITESEQPKRIFPTQTVNRIKKSISPKSDKIKKQIWTWVEPQERWHVKDII